jgi:hypothetical protein
MGGGGAPSPPLGTTPGMVLNSTSQVLSSAPCVIV